MQQIILQPNPQKKLWIVHEEYIYATKNGMKITIRKGFETDLATIPWFLKWRFAKCRVDYATASTVHDAMLQNYRHLGRGFADKIFKEILDITASEYIEELLYDGVSFWTKIKRWF